MPTPDPAQGTETRRHAPGMVACAVCGTESRQPAFRPLPPEQAPDLDMRPGEPLRGSIDRWLQQCPRCGYAAPDIRQARPSAPRVVAAAPFRSLVGDASIPPLCRRFLAWAHVLDETGALHEAAEAMLQAAWTADDLNRPDLAQAWRMDAVALWRAGPPLEAPQSLRVIDALRRAEAWEAAEDAVSHLRATQPDEDVRRVLVLESRLIEARDAGRHTVASALPPPARRPHVSHHKVGARGPGMFGGVFGWFRRLFGRKG